MPVQQSDIRIYGSAGIPLSDTATPVGGAMDPTTEMVFSNIVNNDNFQVVSSNSVDAINFLLTGRNASGAITTELLTLAGLTPVPCEDTTTWTSLLIGLKEASAVGVIAVEALNPLFTGSIIGVTGQYVTLASPPAGVDLSFCVLRVTTGTGAGFIGVILAYNIGTGIAYMNFAPTLDTTSIVRISYGMVFRQANDGGTEVLTVRRPFYNAAAPAPANPSKSILEKVFIYNSNPVLTLNNVQLQQTLQNNVSVSLGVDTAVSLATAAAGNRVGASPVPMFTGTPVAVPGAALPAVTGIGAWLQLNLNPGASPINVPLNFQIQGI